MRSSKKNPIQTLSGSAGLIRAREIISGHYDEYKSVKFIEPHRRNFYTFFLVKQGYIKHSIDFTSYTCSKGQVFFMAPQQVYLVETAVDFGGISISCQPEVLDRDDLNLPVFRNIFHCNQIGPDNEDLTELLHVAERMVVIFHKTAPFSDELMSSYLKTLLIYLSRAWAKENPILSARPEETAVVEKFRLMINEHWKKFIQVSDYAALLHISAGHLNDLIKANEGRAAHELIQERKIIESKRLLMHSDLSVKEIAFEIGFDDPAYFSRFFKKWNNITPLEFRDQIREKYKSSLK